MNLTDPSTTPPSTPVLNQPAHASHSGFGSRIRNYFLTGLILTGPLYITISLTWWFINWVDDLVRPLMPAAFRPETYLPIRVPGLGLIIVFVALTLLGFLTANLVGRTLVEAGERILERMPIIRPLYRGLKQVFETLFSKTGSTFRKVGLIEFPAPGCRPRRNMSRCSCRARPIRPRDSSSSCRAARSSSSTSRWRRPPSW
jgi:Protein of unknown function (DUF502)